MANEILIIGVGSAGIISADKMDLPYSKRLFVDTDYRQLEAVKSEGGKSCCGAKCPSFCHCYSLPDFCKKVAKDYEEEIRECIKNAFKL